MMDEPVNLLALGMTSIVAYYPMLTNLKMAEASAAYLS